MLHCWQPSIRTPRPHPGVCTQRWPLSTGLLRGFLTPARRWRAPRTSARSFARSPWKRWRAAVARCEPWIQGLGMPVLCLRVSAHDRESPSAACHAIGCIQAARSWQQQQQVFSETSSTDQSRPCVGGWRGRGGMRAPLLRRCVHFQPPWRAMPPQPCCHPGLRHSPPLAQAGMIGCMTANPASVQVLASSAGTSQVQGRHCPVQSSRCEGCGRTSSRRC